MAQYSIKDLEKITGIKAHTLRVWEQRYDVVKPERSAFNIRSYNDEDLKKLLTISQLNKQGLKISKIAKMCQEEMASLARKSRTDNRDEEFQFDQLFLALIDLNENAFLSLLNKEKEKKGFEYVMESTVLKLMERIGELWMTGTINPAHEHFSTNLVRRFILAQSSRSKLKKNAKNFVLFLPCHEWHELGLLYLDYLVRNAGHKSYYFGQNTPIKYLQKAIGKVDVDYVVPAWLTQYKKVEKDKLIESMVNAFPKANIIFNELNFPEEARDGKRILNLKGISDFKDLLLQS